MQKDLIPACTFEKGLAPTLGYAIEILHAL